jgi:hypothetical protein
VNEWTSRRIWSSVNIPSGMRRSVETNDKEQNLYPVRDASCSLVYSSTCLLNKSEFKTNERLKQLQIKLKNKRPLASPSSIDARSESRSKLVCFCRARRRKAQPIWRGSRVRTKRNRNESKI